MELINKEVVTNYKFKATIIVLAYNQEEYLEATFKSIEEQDLDSCQIIISDDASTDGSKRLINDFKNSSRFHIDTILNYNNHGITECFNNCLEIAKGEFLFLIGGDDLFCPGKLKAQLAFMESNPSVRISYHNVTAFESHNNRILYEYNEKFGYFSGDALILVKQGTFCCGCSVAVRNHINLPKCNVLIRYSSDWLWYIEILETCAGTIKAMPGTYARYRRHGGNITTISSLETQLSEVLLSLHLIKTKYPLLSKEVNKSSAERLFVYSLKFAKQGNLIQFAQTIISSFRENIFSPFLFIARRLRIANAKNIKH